jgi:putative membrane protein
MKKIIFTIFAISVLGVFSADASAQMMGGFSNSGVNWDEVAEHTLREEKEGKEIWDKFQAKEIACADLNDGQFGVLGEYFMGQMAGNSHTAMNVMLIQRLGEDGEEQMHIAMGKRLSGCDTSATYPQGFNFMPMMGGWSSSTGTGFNQNNNNSMMWGFGNNPMGWGFGWFGGIFMLVFWILIIAGIVLLIKWLVSQSHGTQGQSKTALDILKERYAKGEINKEEFEQKKKELM